MNNTQLLDRLREMHVELAEMNLELDPGEHIDNQTIDALGQLVADVGRLVDQAKSQVDDENVQEEHSDLGDRILAFDQKHPKVRQFLSQMTDVLGMLGI